MTRFKQRFFMGAAVVAILAAPACKDDEGGDGGDEGSDGGDLLYDRLGGEDGITKNEIVPSEFPLRDPTYVHPHPFIVHAVFGSANSRPPHCAMRQAENDAQNGRHLYAGAVRPARRDPLGGFAHPVQPDTSGSCAVLGPELGAPPPPPHQQGWTSPGNGGYLGSHAGRPPLSWTLRGQGLRRLRISQD